MTEQRDAIIVGAGITGLVTAYELQKRGLKVSLLERHSDVGGVIHSEHREGFLLEYGPNSFLESAEANALIAELNLTSEFVSADPKAPRYLYFRCALEPVPMDPLAFIASPLLSIMGKLRIFAEPFIGAYKGDHEESIAKFVRRRLGAEVHDRLVSPFVSGVYAGNTELLSLKACFPLLAELEFKYGSLIWGGIKSAKAAKATNTAKEKPRTGKRLCSFLNGMETLPQALAKKLANDLIKACEITEITVNACTPRYKVRFNHAGAERKIFTDQLILAAPAAATARLIANSLPKLANELTAIEYAPMAIVHLSFEKKLLSNSLNGFGFLVPRTEGIQLLGSIWNSSLFPARAPASQALLTNFIGGAHDPTVADLSDEALIKIASSELQKILQTTTSPQPIAVHKLPRAIPQYTLGHLARVARINELAREQPGLNLAGNYLQGVSVPDCISRAYKLAESIRETVSVQ